MKYIGAVFAIVCRCAYAQCDYSTMLTNMVDALVRPNGTLDAVFTNQLAVYASETTNVFHLADINIVRAISLTDVAEEYLVGDALLPQATSLCSNTLTCTSIPVDAWQRGAAGIVLAGIYSFDGKRADACSVLTNNAVMAAHSISNSDDIALWNALAKHLCVDGLCVQDAIRCYAAIAVIDNDPTCNITSYTNGLPETVLSNVREFLE